MNGRFINSNEILMKCDCYGGEIFKLINNLCYNLF